MTSLRLWLSLLVFLCGPLSAIDKKDVPINKCELNSKKKKKVAISLCSIFRDEAPFLKEWIEYHRLIGVEHFYLYNNCSTDDYWQVLEPYVANGIVELFDVPFDSSLINDFAKTHNFVQVTCYNHAISQCRSKSKWIAIADTDEYICPCEGHNLKSTLKEYDYADGLVIYWVIYGTSNIWDLAPGELMIEKLLLRQPDASQNQFKCIVKPKHAVCKNPHLCNFKKQGFAVFPDHRYFSHTPGYSLLPTSHIRINHYTYRTGKFYALYKKPRKLAWGYNPDPEREANEHAWANSVFDPVMLPIIPALREAMNK